MIRAAVIGTGNIAPSHIQGYLTFPDQVTIVALVDIYPEKAHRMAERFELDVDVYDDHKALLERDDIDLVSVCTPPYTHSEITVNCLNAGFHVLVEKPMASSLAECDAMLDAAAENGKTLSVVAQNRFTTPMMKLKQMLEKDMIGPIVHAQVDSHWWRGHCYYDLWWRGTWEKEGGGPTLNHAVHHIDALGWMLGMPQRVTAVMANTAHDNSQVEDLSVAILQYAQGTLGQVTSSVVHHGEEQQLIFQGQKARISTPWKVKASVSRDNGFPDPDQDLKTQLQTEYDNLSDLEYQGHTAQIQNVLQSLTEGSDVLIDGTSGRNTLELITAIYKAASTDTPVDLPLSENDPFYTREGIIKHAKYFYEKGASVENFADSQIRVSGEEGKP